MPSDALTQKIRQPRVGLLKLGQFVNILRDAERSGNQTGVVVACIRTASGVSLALRSGPRVPPPGRAISRNCELIVLNAFLRAKAEIAHQVSRILGAQAALLSTRQAVEEQLKWWEK